VLVCYRPLSRTKKEYVVLPDHLKKDLASINLKVQEKTITAHDAETLLAELIAVQYRKSKVQTTAIKHVVLSEANLKVFAQFWAEKYEIKYLEDESSARYDFQRAFKAIEPLSILAASEPEIQKTLKKNLTNSQTRRVVDRLNEVLKFLGRDFQLKKPKKARKTVNHVNLTDFSKLCAAIECAECKLMTSALFATGLRLGEAMALTESDLDGSALSVTKQRTAYGLKKIKAPKREKTGDVAVLEVGLKDLKKWIAVEDKWAHRWHFGTELEKACAVAKVKRISCPSSNYNFGRSPSDFVYLKSNHFGSSRITTLMAAAT